MSDKKKNNKPSITLEDYISSEPDPAPSRKKAARDSLSDADRKRLEALERAVRETEPDAVRGKRKKRKGTSRANQRRDSDTTKMNKLVFWAIVIMLIVGFASLD